MSTELRWTWGRWEEAHPKIWILRLGAGDLLEWASSLPYEPNPGEDLKFFLSLLRERKGSWRNKLWEELSPGVLREVGEASNSSPPKEAPPLPVGKDPLKTHMFLQALKELGTHDWDRLEEAYFYRISNLDNPDYLWRMNFHRHYALVETPTYAEKLHFPEVPLSGEVELPESTLVFWESLDPWGKVASLAAFGELYCGRYEEVPSLFQHFGEKLILWLWMLAPLWKALPSRVQTPTDRSHAIWPFRLWLSWKLPWLWLASRLDPNDLDLFLKVWGGKTLEIPEPDFLQTHPDPESLVLEAYQEMVDELEALWRSQLEEEKIRLSQLPNLAANLKAHSRLLLQIWKELAKVKK